MSDRLDMLLSPVKEKVGVRDANATTRRQKTRKALQADGGEVARRRISAAQRAKRVTPTGHRGRAGCRVSGMERYVKGG